MGGLPVGFHLLPSTKVSSASEVERERDENGDGREIGWGMKCVNDRPRNQDGYGGFLSMFLEGLRYHFALLDDVVGLCIAPTWFGLNPPRRLFCRGTQQL